MRKMFRKRIEKRKKQIHFITETDVMKMNEDSVRHALVDYYSRNNREYPSVLVLEWRDEEDSHWVMLVY